MTPVELLTHLRALPEVAPLIFRTEDGPISGGYHVAEWKQTTVQSIDCGAARASWTESVLQLLDGSGGKHMSNCKFVGILDQSIRHVEGLGDSPMQVEFAHGNRGLGLFKPTRPIAAGDAIMLELVVSRPVCKPAERIANAMTDGRSAKRRSSGCCG